MPLQRRSPRAFTLVLIPLILVVTLVIFGVIISVFAPTKTSASGAYQKGQALGPGLGAALFGLFWLWIASRLAERRSHGTATAVVGAILLLANFAMGVNAYRAYNGIAAPQPRSPIATLAPTPASPTPFSPIATPSTPVPTVPTATLQPTPPQAFTPPVTTHPVSTPEPRPVAPVVVTPAPEPPPSASALQALEDLRAEFESACTALAADAELLYAAAARPKLGKADAQKAVDMATKLQAQAQALWKRLARGSNEAIDVLQQAGMSGFEAHNAAGAMSDAMNLHKRAVAANQVSMFAEQAVSLFTLIRDNPGAIRLDAKGTLSSKDRKLDAQMFGPRSQVGWAVDKKDQVLQVLRNTPLETKPGPR